VLVRAVVPETDDPSMPLNTLRMWIVGIIWTMLGSGVNQFFSLRYPAVHIVSLVAELLAFPMGVALAHILPIYTMDLGPLGKWNINPDRHFVSSHSIVRMNITDYSAEHQGACSDHHHVKRDNRLCFRL